jgi:hypothetical protein
MFRATFCSSSGALLNRSRSLRFPYKSRGGCVLSQQTDHGWKHIHLGFYTGTGGCGYSSKVFLMMGKTLPETC